MYILTEIVIKVVTQRNGAATVHYSDANGKSEKTITPGNEGNLLIPNVLLSIEQPLADSLEAMINGVNALEQKQLALNLSEEEVQQ